MWLDRCVFIDRRMEKAAFPPRLLVSGIAAVFRGVVGGVDFRMDDATVWFEC